MGLFRHPSNTVARWTRSKGFELPYPSVTTVGNVVYETGASTTPPRAVLYQMEYNGNGTPSVLKSIPLPLGGLASLSIKEWILQALKKDEATLFHNIKRGRYWEVCVEITPDEIAQLAADASLHRSPIAMNRMSVSERIALLLLAYGPLPTASLANGLSLSVPSIKGAVGRLISKGLVKRDTDPYTPVSNEQLHDWLKEKVLSAREYNEGGELVEAGSISGSQDRWKVVLAHKPWLLSDRYAEFQQRQQPSKA